MSINPRQAIAQLAPLKALLARTSCFAPQEATGLLLQARDMIKKLPQELRPEAQSMLAQACATLESLLEPTRIPAHRPEPEVAPAGGSVTIKLAPGGTSALLTTAYGNVIEITSHDELLRVLRITAPAPRRATKLPQTGPIVLAESDRFVVTKPDGTQSPFGTGKVKKLTETGKQIATLDVFDFTLCGAQTNEHLDN